MWLSSLTIWVVAKIFFKFCPLDGEVPLQCGETTYSGVSVSMFTTIGTCLLFSTCDMAARNYNTCAAGATASHVPHCRPMSVNVESLSPIACVTCGAVVRYCVVRKIGEVFILKASAEKRGVREIFGELQIKRDLVVVQPRKKWVEYSPCRRTIGSGGSGGGSSTRRDLWEYGNVLRKYGTARV